MTVNFIIGIGSFGVPYAIYAGGVGLSSLTLCVCVGMLIATGIYVLEVMSRATAYLEYGARNIQAGDTPKQYVKMDYAAVAAVFGGKWGQALAQIALALYCYGILWAYVASCASALASASFQFFIRSETCDIYNQPSGDCWFAYYCSVLALAVVGIPLALLEVAEQWHLQMALTAYRFLAFAVMFVTCAVNLMIGGPVNSAPIWGFKISGFAVMFTSLAIAQTMHYNLASAVTPVRNKSRLRLVVVFAELTALFFNMAVGIVCVANFGARTEPLAVLNWATYTGRAGGWGAGATLWWAYIVQAIVAFFPVLNVMSNFPLVCITLGNNTHTFLPQSVVARFGSRGTHAVCRLLAALPPLCLGFAFGRLDMIFTVTGLVGFALVYFLPCGIALASERLMRAAKLDPWTPYSGWYSHRLVVSAVLLFGVIAFIFSVVDAVAPQIFK
eukprot:TRINITY_DN3749_c1_g1_i1.p1 TRINITY_DN3749_c1_g1~~TRINITY_DN3749_c1_g1_i1.p1  ORF type:complete len:471 (+),score=82.40 TRINITY_DN3749_c1_g1_i1:87-1415(+)